MLNRAQFTNIGPDQRVTGSNQAKDGKKMPEGWWNPGGAIITDKNVDEIIARQKDNTTRTRYYQSEVDKQLANPDQYLKPLPG